MSVDERKALPYMHPGRADVIGAGALIWSGILARAGTPTVLVSEADLLHGIAATVAHGAS
jgi:exopolyphosphatase/guanosine-5'-triphosphate,3'-diphosphate pyrophosphatase